MSWAAAVARAEAVVHATMGTPATYLPDAIEPGTAVVVVVGDPAPGTEQVQGLSASQRRTTMQLPIAAVAQATLATGCAREPRMGDLIVIAAGLMDAGTYAIDGPAMRGVDHWTVPVVASTAEGRWSGQA